MRKNSVKFEFEPVVQEEMLSKGFLSRALVALLFIRAELFSKFGRGH